MNEKPIHPDAKIIQRLGGSTAVARRLKFDMEKGPQRVNNWTRRGIPAQVKVDFPEVFMKPKAA